MGMLFYGISKRGVIVTDRPHDDPLRLPLWRTAEAAQEVLDSKLQRYDFAVVEFEVRDNPRRAAA